MARGGARRWDEGVRGIGRAGTSLRALLPADRPAAPPQWLPHRPSLRQMRRRRRRRRHPRQMRRRRRHPRGLGRAGLQSWRAARPGASVRAPCGACLLSSAAAPRCNAAAPPRSGLAWPRLRPWARARAQEGVRPNWPGTPWRHRRSHCSWRAAHAPPWAPRRRTRGVWRAAPGRHWPTLLPRGSPFRGVLRGCAPAQPYSRQSVAYRCWYRRSVRSPRSRGAGRLLSSAREVRPCAFLLGCLAAAAELYGRGIMRGILLAALHARDSSDAVVRRAAADCECRSRISANVP
jgi:hypothetical protein